LLRCDNRFDAAAETWRALHGPAHGMAFERIGGTVFGLASFFTNHSQAARDN